MPMPSLGTVELTALLFLAASLVLMFHVPDAVAKLRDGRSTRRDWFPVAAATLVLITMAAAVR